MLLEITTCNNPSQYERKCSVFPLFEIRAGLLDSIFRQEILVIFQEAEGYRNGVILAIMRGRRRLEVFRK